MFGAQERLEVTTAPSLMVNKSPVTRRDIRVVTSQKTKPKAGQDAKVMTDLLVAVAEHKDRKAFSDLFAYYAPRIKSYLIRQGAPESAAEEMSQEAMLSVWRKADRYDPSKAGAGTWIFTVARNLRIDVLRKENRPSFDPEDPAFIPDPEVAPDTAVSIVETQQSIKDAVATLPKEQADVVRLSFYEDKAHAEIAQELGLPLGTVKSRLRLAMRRVRSALGEEI